MQQQRCRCSGQYVPRANDPKARSFFYILRTLKRSGRNNTPGCSTSKRKRATVTRRVLYPTEMTTPAVAARECDEKPFQVAWGAASVEFLERLMSNNDLDASQSVAGARQAVSQDRV